MAYADVFMYPVDSQMFPEYYEIIEQPMDLSTIKSKINDYSNVEEAIADIRLVWENCRIFNSDESDIVSWANALAEASEVLMAEHLGEDYHAPAKKDIRRKKAAVVESSSSSAAAELNSVKKSSSKASASRASEGTTPAAVGLPKKVLVTILADLKNHECAFPFLHPVNVDEAPGYSDLIREPMDLSTVEKKAKTGLFDSDLLAFVNQVNLIWKNCVLYNDPASTIADWARIMALFFQDKLTEAASGFLSAKDWTKARNAMKKAIADLSPNQADDDRMNEDEHRNMDVDEDAPASAASALGTTSHAPIEGAVEKKKRGPPKSALKFKKSELSPLGRAMWSFIDDLKDEPMSSPFHHPIDLQAIPIYASKIAQPMDLFTLKSKIPTYLQLSQGSDQQQPQSEEGAGAVDTTTMAVDAFFRDLLLIFENCKSFNGIGSELYDVAVDMEKIAVEKFATFFTKQEDGRYLVAEGMVNKKRKYKAKKSLNDDADDADGFGERGSDDEDEDELLSSMKSSAEIDKFIAILRSDKGLRVLSVKNKAMSKSRELCNAISYPWLLVPQLIEIQSLGAINNNAGYHSVDHVYPPGYRSSCLLHIQVLPIDPSLTNTPALTRKQYIPIAVTSTIIAIPGLGPRFVLTIDGGTVIAQGSSPRDAWLRLFDTDAIANLLNIRSGRLKHCRALLNRIAVDHRARALIDRNSMDESLATYSCPLWLRKISQRLAHGCYDNEFDFAYDMRFIFRHVLASAVAGEEGSSTSTSHAAMQLWKDVQELKEIFEYYFCKWVINYQHRSTVDLARGAWEGWDTIRLFDDPTYPSIAGAHHCHLCENHLHDEVSMNMDESAAEHHPHEHEHRYCSRCQLALNELPVPNFETASSATQQRHNISYQREEMNLPCFIPNPDMGDIGWCQALRQRRGGLKGVYLSPLGFYIKDKSGDYLDKVKQYEASIDAHLREELEVSIDESVTSWQRRRNLGIGSFLKLNPGLGHWSYQAWTSELEVVDADASGLETEDMRIIVGELMHYQLPAGYYFAITLPTDALAALRSTDQAHRPIDEVLNNLTPHYSVPALSHTSWQKIGPTDIPATGYFGLDIPEVKIRIEGLNAIELCLNYRSLSADIYRQQLIDELLREREVILKQEELQQSVLSIVESERWLHEKKRMIPAKPPSISSANSSIGYLEEKGFSSLFSANIDSQQHGEVLLCVWDLLDLISSLAGDWTFALSEVLSCLENHPHASYTSLGNIIYDEILSLFTGILLQDLYSSVQDVDVFQTILTAQPLNLLTWPCILRSLANASRSIGWAKIEMTELMLSPEYDSWQSQAMDVLLLLMKHPVIRISKKILVSAENSSAIAQVAQAAVTGLDSLREKLYQDQSIESLEAFADLLRDSLTSMLNAAKQSNHSLAEELISNLALWTKESLLRVHSINIDIDIKQLTSSKLSAASITELSKISPTIDDFEDKMFLQPQHFSSDAVHGKLPLAQAIFDKDLDVLQAYETSLKKLRCSDPDRWSKEEKVQMLKFAMDMVSSTMLLQNHLKERRDVLRQHFRKIEDVPANPSSLASAETPYFAITIPEEEAVQVLCCYTGSPLTKLQALSSGAAPSTARSSSSMRYVSVTSALLDPPSTSPTKQDKEEPHTYLKHEVAASDLLYQGKFFVSIESFANRILAARELAATEAKKHDARMAESYASLATSPLAISQAATNNTAKPFEDSFYLRSQPLGYDRHGSQYWLLTAQDSMTISALGRYTINQLSDAHSLDPAILVKHVSGWWGKHSGSKLQNLVSSFAADVDCERVLRDNIIIRLTQARYRLYANFLRPKSHQNEWLARRCKAEDLLKDIEPLAPAADKLTSSELSTSQIGEISKQQELVWNRASEIRQMMHYSMLLKKDFDVDGLQPRAEREAYARRQRRIREQNAEDTLDLHPSRGWLRFHCLSHVRELAVSTTASRIHAEPAILASLRENNQKSSFRAKWMHRTTRQFESAAVEPSTTKDPPLAPAVATTTKASMAAMQTDDADIFQDDELLIAAAGNNSNNKAVAQLHPVTGDVLRIHPSGKVAAAFMGVSPAGISLCCSGKSQESFGFRWKFYEGPPIDWELLKDKQMSKEELLTIAAKHKREASNAAPVNALDMVISTAIVPSSTSTRASSSIPSFPPHMGRTSLGVSSFGSASSVLPSLAPPPAQVAVIPGKLPPNFIATTVLVSPRLLKLKTEIINLLLLLPEKQMRWPDPEPEPETEGEPAGDAQDKDTTVATSSTPSAAVAVAAPDTSITMDDSAMDATTAEVRAPTSTAAAPAPAAVETAEERALRKKKRRDKRRAAFDKIFSRIQAASTPQQLFDCLLSIEAAMPPAWSLALDQLQTQEASEIQTCADVAVRLFSLDRAIRYDEIPSIDSVVTAPSKLLYRPRTQFVPRCMVSVSCRGYMNHSSKQCGHFQDPGSRYPEISDAMPASSIIPPSRASTYPSNSYASTAGGYGGSVVGQVYGGQPSYTSSRVSYPVQPMSMPGYRGATASGITAYTAAGSRSHHAAQRGGAMHGDDDEDEFEDMDSATRKTSRSCIHIEFAQPYMPPASKITMVEWI
jgi:hypothetical protein